MQLGCLNKGKKQAYFWKKSLLAEKAQKYPKNRFFWDFKNNFIHK